MIRHEETEAEPKVIWPMRFYGYGACAVLRNVLLHDCEHGQDENDVKMVRMKMTLII